MKRYIAAYYRRRWLYALALLVMLFGAATGTYIILSSQYASTARIWIDKAPLDTLLDRLDQNNQPALGLTAPPAQRQAEKLYQLAQTDTFMLNVIKGTSLTAKLTGDPDSDARELAKIRDKLAIGALGPNTMSITFYSPDPLLCQQVVQGTIDTYRTWLLQTQFDQRAVETLFYQDQLKNYQDQLDAANRRVVEYQQANPHSEPLSPQYLELQRLQDDVKSAQALYSATKSRIDQAGIVQSLSDKSGRSEFQVLDKPALSQRPATSIRKLAQYFGLGVAASLAVIVAVGIFTTWQDTTIRSADDLARITTIPVLQVIPPDLQPKEGKKPRRGGRLASRSPRPAVATGQGAD